MGSHPTHPLLRPWTRVNSSTVDHDTLKSILTMQSFWFSPVPDYIKASVDAVIGIHLEEGPGDILVFLTGQVRRWV